MPKSKVRKKSSGGRGVPQPPPALPRVHGRVRVLGYLLGGLVWTALATLLWACVLVVPLLPALMRPVGEQLHGDDVVAVAFLPLVAAALGGGVMPFALQLSGYALLLWLALSRSVRPAWDGEPLTYAEGRTRFDAMHLPWHRTRYSDRLARMIVGGFSAGPMAAGALVAVGVSVPALAWGWPLATLLVVVAAAVGVVLVVVGVRVGVRLGAGRGFERYCADVARRRRARPQLDLPRPRRRAGAGS
ncbi:hypothetical protein CLV28_3012 [Sediminihabitans luteus]|uniref:Sensor protein n=1 Tax=Sediminihabitans luteus TaxID=1138585 RepID=A0A2M9CC33_9CELL|nr:hypothetical protein [Sediminihabitans luteus]PJJ68596.1 hypothetical protein CLV28_3012 [Sediminihabitans luteus]GII99934.1 hypothetical protein Slu03_23120 [Sediminihabitans luteus]